MNTKFKITALSKARFLLLWAVLLMCGVSWAAPGDISTFAGTGTSGFSGDGGAATAAQFDEPRGIAMDSAGNLFIADRFNNRIRKVTPSGLVTTVAGGGTGSVWGDGGAATAALLYDPYSVAVDSAGNLFIVERTINRIRKVNTSGIITTIAGTGTGAGGFSGDGGPATAAQFYHPSGIAVDSAGNVFIADSNNLRIRKINTSGIITTVAGNGAAQGNFGDGGAATAANLSYPLGVAVDSAGNLFIADTDHNRIRKVDTSGIITTVAATGASGFLGDGGAATAARLDSPKGVTLDSAGNLFIADYDNYRIRKVNTSGIITTVAGNGTFGFSGDGGAATAASLHAPSGVAVDSAGNLFIADTYNHRIRKVAGNAIVPPPASSSLSINSISANEGNTGTTNFVFTVTRNGNTAGTSRANYATINGTATAPADYASKTGTVTFAAGATTATITILVKGDTVYEPDETFSVTLSNAIGASISGATGVGTIVNDEAVGASDVINTVAGSGYRGYSGDGGAATAADFDHPFGVAIDRAGNFYVADPGNHRVRKVSASGVVTTVAGIGAFGFSGDGGAANLAQLYTPLGVAVDSVGNLFIADSGNSRIRKVNTNGVIRTVAGASISGFSGDGGAATAASLNHPKGVAIDSAGNLFIADTNNSRIRKVNTSGVIITVAGNGTSGFSGDGSAATAASLNFPTGVALNSAGDIYVADYPNHRIRKVNTSGVITTVAGNGTFGFSGDGGAANETQLDRPHGVAVDGAGNLLIADSGNSRIRKVDSSGIISTVAGTTFGFSGDGGAATAAKLYFPAGVAVDSAGNLFIADAFNNRIRKVDAFASNTAPVATAQSITTTKNVAKNGTLTATDADGNALTFAKVSDPTHGSLVVNDFGNFTYTPTASYIGSDSFTFVANDGTVDSLPATVTVTVTELPTPTLDVTLSPGSPKTNDTLTVVYGGFAASYRYVWKKNGQRIAGESAATLQLSKAGNGDRDDIIQVELSATNRDMTATGVAQVTVANSAPILANVTFNATRNVAFSQQLAGSDADGDSLTYKIKAGVLPNGLRLSGRGLIYGTPTQVETQIVTVRVRDDQGGVADARITINVAQSNRAPILSKATFNLTQNAAFSGRLAGTDADKDRLTYKVVRGTLPAGLQLLNNGLLRGTPTVAGSRIVKVEVSDGKGGTDSANITINVTAPSDLSAPARLIATGEVGQIRLNWDDRAKGETGYKIERLAGGKWSLIARGTTANQTNYVDKNVVAGTIYSYRVSAYVYGVAVGKASNVASAKALSNSRATPTGLSASAA